ncbi:MAG: glycoside hydrolase family 5 protein, partial [Mangrovibacterium sp.]
IGWNLGNTYEVYPGTFSWGNGTASQGLMDLVAASGFSTVRIPVAWSNHLLTEAPNYTIDPSWMTQVKTVVDYARNAGLFVMINIHWDGGWADDLSYEAQPIIEAKQAALWKQIAKQFRDYDYHLLFAGGNEPHMDYNAPAEEYLAVANSMNQVFVNTVRATGGRNAYRYLISQGYNTNIAYTVSGYVLPTDEAENRQMVEVHYYDPYNFTLDTGANAVTTWEAAGWGDQAWLDEQFGLMKTSFIDKGVGVIVGEFCATYRGNLPTTNNVLADHIASRNNFHYAVTKSAIENGLVPCYWDIGEHDNNGSGLFNRSSLQVWNQAEVDAIMRAK